MRSGREWRRMVIDSQRESRRWDAREKKRRKKETE
jgi:hypothetical protein